MQNVCVFARVRYNASEVEFGLSNEICHNWVSGDN